MAVRNIGALEFPLYGEVSSEDIGAPSDECVAAMQTIQGGALKTYPFEQNINSVQVGMLSCRREMQMKRLLCMRVWVGESRWHCLRTVSCNNFFCVFAFKRREHLHLV